MLLGRRHAGHKFMPGKFVFPGGRVEPGDRRMSVAGPLDPVVEEKLNARTKPAHAGLRARAGAGRHPRDLRGNRPRLGREGLWGAAEGPRRRMGALCCCGAFPALDGLDFIARAITPPRRPKRFDTRFFAADAALIAHRAPGIVNPDAELVELVWTPLGEAAKLDMPIITRVVLAELESAARAGMNRFRARPFYHERHKRWLREEL